MRVLGFLCRWGSGVLGRRLRSRRRRHASAALMAAAWLCHVLHDETGFNSIIQDYIGFYWILQDYTGLYGIVQDYTGVGLYRCGGMSSLLSVP